MFKAIKRKLSLFRHFHKEISSRAPVADSVMSKTTERETEGRLAPLSWEEEAAQLELVVRRMSELVREIALDARVAPRSLKITGVDSLTQSIESAGTSVMENHVLHTSARLSDQARKKEEVARILREVESRLAETIGPYRL